jgi:predicted RNase H-like HicB family nuclease
MKYKEMIAVCIEALKEQEVIINSIEERVQKVVVRAKEKGLL